MKDKDMLERLVYFSGNVVGVELAPEVKKLEVDGEKSRAMTFSRKKLRVFSVESGGKYLFWRMMKHVFGSDVEEGEVCTLNLKGSKARVFVSKFSKESGSEMIVLEPSDLEEGSSLNEKVFDAVILGIQDYCEKHDLESSVQKLD